MTRFAGTELSNYMSTPDFTGLGRTMMEGASLGRRAVNAAEGDVALAGINSQAKIKSSGYEAEAIKAGGQARGQSAMFQGLGSMASGIAGGFGARGSGSPGIGTGSGFGEIGTAGSDMADFGYTPAQDIAFNNGTGIDYGWL